MGVGTGQITGQSCRVGEGVAGTGVGSLIGTSARDSPSSIAVRGTQRWPPSSRSSHSESRVFPITFTSCPGFRRPTASKFSPGPMRMLTEASTLPAMLTGLSPIPSYAVTETWSESFVAPDSEVTLTVSLYSPLAAKRQLKVAV